jgi:hypothetical protein
MGQLDSACTAPHLLLLDLRVALRHVGVHVVLRRLLLAHSLLGLGRAHSLLLLLGVVARSLHLRLAHSLLRLAHSLLGLVGRDGLEDGQPPRLSGTS